MRAFIVVFFIVLILAAAYGGYLFGKRESDAARFESVVIEAGNDLLLYDAFLSGKTEGVLDLITAKIENNFADLALLYGDYEFKSSEYIRCAVTRRVRKDTASNIFFKDKDRERYSEISNYMMQECDGEPSHKNWVTGQRDR
jgi:hypothetical protein